MFSLSRSLSRRCVVDLTATAASAARRSARRAYISRAHPKPIPEFPVIDAIQYVCDDATKRREKREERERLYKIRFEQSKETPSKEAKHEGKTMPPWRRGHPDETIELALNLNLDPRKPGQALRGSVTLPHGTGKKAANCVVFASDEEAQQKALAAGAAHAGGESLVDQIVEGEIPVDTLQASVGTKEMMPILTKKAARLLGPRKLMPNVKVGTLVETTEELVDAVQTQVSGKELLYRTENDGIVHVPVGKHSFGVDKLLENIGAVMKEIFNARPDSYGKGKQKVQRKKGQAVKKTQPQYLLRAHVCSTQSPSVRIDLRTVDPNSVFFLSPLDPLVQANSPARAA